MPPLRVLEQEGTQEICLAFSSPAHHTFSAFFRILLSISLEKEKAIIPTLQLRCWHAERLTCLILGLEEKE